MAVARRGLPRQIEFGESYPSLVGLSTTGWEMDREYLVELDRAAWDSVVAEFRGNLHGSRSSRRRSSGCRRPITR